MKAYVMTVVVIDHDELGLEEVKRTLEDANFPNDCISPKIEKIEEFDIGEWDDDHPMNKRDTDTLAWLWENGK